MQLSFCPDCGSPLSGPEARLAGTTRHTYRLVCPECNSRLSLQPGVVVAGLLTREGESGPELLLVRRQPEAHSGAGLYCLPGRTLAWNEDAREAVIDSCWNQTGLKVRIREAYDVHSNFHDRERLTVGTWFRLEQEGTNGQEPRAGEDADLARFVSLNNLPDLAFPTDRLVIERLKREEAPEEGQGAEARHTALMARLTRRRQKYRDLLQAYTDELMRGTWINELHWRLSEAQTVDEMCSITAEHIVGRREVDKVQIWFPGPPDRCPECPWANRCAKEQCLHLIAHMQDRGFDSEIQGVDDPFGGREEAPPDDQQRIPILRGVPAADVALQDAPVQAELPGAGAQPTRFNGFPLDRGEELAGVLGLISRVPIDANARRLFEVVARHVGALVANARLVEDLRAANNVKRSFIARLSHELKTPITAILGFAELLREELEAEGNSLGADGAATIESSGRKLLNIVESILEIAKLESSAAGFDSGRVDLDQVVREQLQIMQEQVDEKGLSLELELPPGPSPSFTVWGDRARVGQILGQILDNALRFTPEGSISVSLEPADDKVTCHIQDTGIGIPAESHKVIFDAFSQGKVSEDVHLRYGGLGLGLAIAKILVEKQGGRIWLDSHPGQGSRFSFTLPRSATVVG